MPILAEFVSTFIIVVQNLLTLVYNEDIKTHRISTRVSIDKIVVKSNAVDDIIFPFLVCVIKPFL